MNKLSRWKRLVRTLLAVTPDELSPTWADEVRELARQRDAVILAHNYQVPEIQDIADHVGDSLGLSRVAATVDASTIVFCGVHFMAETAKILSYDKTVLIPDERAGCSLAETITAEQLRAVEGRAPRRGRRQLRQHHRRGEGRDRHLLHVVERGRRGRSRSPRTRSAVLPRPVPRRPRPADHRPRQHAHLDGRVPRARRHQRRRPAASG